MKFLIFVNVASLALMVRWTFAFTCSACKCTLYVSHTQTHTMRSNFFFRSLILYMLLWMEVLIWLTSGETRMHLPPETSRQIDSDVGMVGSGRGLIRTFIYEKTHRTFSIRQIFNWKSHTHRQTPSYCMWRDRTKEIFRKILQKQKINRKRNSVFFFTHPPYCKLDKRMMYNFLHTLSLCLYLFFG